MTDPVNNDLITRLAMPNGHDEDTRRDDEDDDGNTMDPEQGGAKISL